MKADCDARIAVRIRNIFICFLQISIYLGFRRRKKTKIIPIWILSTWGKIKSFLYSDFLRKSFIKKKNRMRTRFSFSHYSPVFVLLILWFVFHFAQRHWFSMMIFFALLTLFDDYFSPADEEEEKKKMI
jgi:hypothetical protein